MSLSLKIHIGVSSLTLLILGGLFFSDKYPEISENKNEVAEEITLSRFDTPPEISLPLPPTAVFEIQKKSGDKEITDYVIFESIPKTQKFYDSLSFPWVSLSPEWEKKDNKFLKKFTKGNEVFEISLSENTLCLTKTTLEIVQ